MTIGTTTEFIEEFKKDLGEWGTKIRPWFRGESGDKIDPPLCPKIVRFAKDGPSKENHLLQTFRRKAGGLSNTPTTERTDLWLFLAQHYGVPTRLFDWTEGALIALYFAINKRNHNPRVYMLNPHMLNYVATGTRSDGLNHPLTWPSVKSVVMQIEKEELKNGVCLTKTTAREKRVEGYENIAIAWEEQNPERGYDLPVAIPATYQDSRMIAQRSCFTVHGKKIESLSGLLGDDDEQCLGTYEITDDEEEITAMLKELAIFGVSSATIFPDLDNLAKDLKQEVCYID